MTIINKPKIVVLIVFYVLLLAGIYFYFTNKYKVNSAVVNLGTQMKVIKPSFESKYLKNRILIKNDLNMNLDIFLKINESNMFGYTGSRLISGVITEINQDTVSIETLNDGIVKTKLMRGDDPNNTTKVFVRNNFSNTDGSYVTLDSLTNEESGRLGIVIFDISTNNLYKLEIFK